MCVCVCASLLTPCASQPGKHNQDFCALNNILAVWLHMHMVHPKLHMVIAVMYVTSKIANMYATSKDVPHMVQNIEACIIAQGKLHLHTREGVSCLREQM